MRRIPSEIWGEPVHLFSRLHRETQPRPGSLVQVRLQSDAVPWILGETHEYGLDRGFWSHIGHRPYFHGSRAVLYWATWPKDDLGFDPFLALHGDSDHWFRWAEGWSDEGSEQPFDPAEAFRLLRKVGGAV